MESVNAQPAASRNGGWRSSRKGRALLAVKSLMTIGLLTLLLRTIDAPATVRLLRETDAWLFAAAWCVVMMQSGVAALRWHLVVRHQQIRLPFGRLFRFVWIGLFFNQVLPSSVGGDAMRGYYLYREGNGIGGASVAVLLDRLSGMLGLVLLVLATLPLSMAHTEDGAIRWGVLLVVGGSIGALGALFVLDMMPVRIRHWRLARGLSTLAKDARRQMLSTSPGVALVHYSVAVHLISVLAIGILARAAGLEVSWMGLAMVVPLATLLTTVPISIAGWGVREGVMVVGLGHVGVGPEQALALSILYGLLLLAVALPGGIVWLLNGHLLGRTTEARRTDQHG